MATSRFSDISFVVSGGSPPHGGFVGVLDIGCLVFMALDFFCLSCTLSLEKSGLSKTTIKKKLDHASHFGENRTT